MDSEAPSSSSILLGSQIDPSTLHPLASILDNQHLDYLLLEDDKLSSTTGPTALPTRGWADELCYGTGSTYLAGQPFPFSLLCPISPFFFSFRQVSPLEDSGDSAKDSPRLSLLDPLSPRPSPPLLTPRKRKQPLPSLLLPPSAPPLKPLPNQLFRRRVLQAPRMLPSESKLRQPRPGRCRRDFVGTTY